MPSKCLQNALGMPNGNLHQEKKFHNIRHRGQRNYTEMLDKFF
jgi:hypothetical protein